MCLSVGLANILVFYLSAVRGAIELKFIQDTVVLNSLYLPSKEKGEAHRDGTLFLKVQ